MDYNELIGLVRETNRPPGGEKTIVRVAQELFLRENHRVLEIGTSTGITAIELARLTNATVIGIDINPQSLEEAKVRAIKYGTQKKTIFEKEDATNLSYPDGSFDVVFCGNVTSLIADREKALEEYSRVLKTGGFLVAVPMYYVQKPSAKLIKEVSKAIRVAIKPLYKEYWVEFFNVEPFQIYFQEDYCFDNISPEKVNEFVDTILGREHLKCLKPEARDMLDKKYFQYMQLFRKNLAHMGYTILILRKEPEPVDPELFTSKKVMVNNI
ncbi:class I SAM-dependent methyltransferase [Candidatus Woesearchaeota archaeon]|nr:class I SAM-dependent methyltransferase [Candidatus Woesearchaeota archaeon]